MGRWRRSVDLPDSHSDPADPCSTLGLGRAEVRHKLRDEWVKLAELVRCLLQMVDLVVDVSDVPASSSARGRPRRAPGRGPDAGRDGSAERARSAPHLDR